MRPKDWAYGAEFDHDDLQYLYQMCRNIRAEQEDNNRRLDEWYAKCEQRLNDHKPVIRVGNKNIEFIQVVKSHDLAVNDGIDQYIRLVMNTSTIRWRYIAFGANGSVLPLVTDFGLISEYGAARIDTSTQGWARVAGTKMMFGGVVGETAAASPIAEMGVSNAVSAQLS